MGRRVRATGFRGGPGHREECKGQEGSGGGRGGWGRSGKAQDPEGTGRVRGRGGGAGLPRRGARRGGPLHPTFQAADPPEARVGEAAGVLLLRGAAAAAGRGPVVARREVGGVADEGARVEPVVRADGDGHEAEGREGAHRRQQHLHPLLAPKAPLFVPALQRLQFDHGQPGGRGPPPGQRGRGRAGGWGGVTAQAEVGGPGAGEGATRRRLRPGRGSEGGHGLRLVEGRERDQGLDGKASPPRYPLPCTPPKKSLLVPRLKKLLPLCSPLPPFP